MKRSKFLPKPDGSKSGDATELLSRLDLVRETADGWVARCPAHSDENPSLSISVGNDGRILIHCHAGCEPEDIVSSIDLTMADLFSGSCRVVDRLTVEELAADKGLSAEFLKQFGVQQQNGHVEIPYYMMDGKLAPRSRMRTALKAKDGSAWMGTKSDGSIVPYGLDHLEDARKAGYLVCVEGESDVWTLWKNDFPALGIPGATMAKTLEAAHLEGIESMYVLREPDKAGDVFVTSMLNRLRLLDFKGKVFEVSLNGAKDANDLHKKSPEEFKSVFRSALNPNMPIDLDAWPDLDNFDEPEVMPFPVNVLPIDLREFVYQISQSMTCPIDFVGVPMLIVAGAAIGNSRAIRLKPSWLERPILYGGCIGHPGTAKSPPLSATVAPLCEIQERFSAEWYVEMEEWKAIPKNERPDRPEMERVLCNDATVEALARVLASNPRGVLLYRDELVGWTRSFDQYKGHGADRQFWLSCWSGESVVVDRKGSQDPIVVDRAFVCVVGSLTPDMLSELMDSQGRSDGSLERLLLVFPATEPPGKWSSTGVSKQVIRAWRATVEHLLALEAEGNGMVVHLSPKAKHVWEEWYNKHTAELDDPGLLPSLIGTWSKMRAHCARFALIIHMLRLATGEIGERNIDEESMRRAVRLAAYFKSHAFRVHRLIAGRFGALSNDAQAVLAWAQRHKFREFNEKQLFDHLRRRFGTHETMRAVLGELMRLFLIRLVPTVKKGRGRKPSARYQIHPEILSRR